MRNQFTHSRQHHDGHDHGRGRFGGFENRMHPEFAGGFGGFGPRGFTPGAPQRKRRGDIRIAIISLLSEQAYNGYGLIKEISERSGDSWRPSPGSVYPTLQQLVDEELIESIGEGKRTEFQLTEQGRAWVTEHAEQLAQVWKSSDERRDADAGLHESIAKLMGVVHQLRFAATEDQRAKAIEKLDETRRALYGILAD